MIFILKERDSFSKRGYQTLENFQNKAKDARQAGRIKAWLADVYSNLLQEKLVTSILL